MCRVLLVTAAGLPCVQFLSSSLLAAGSQEDPALTKTWKKTVTVAVTGASGNIANHLLFMVKHALMRHS